MLSSTYAVFHGFIHFNQVSSPLNISLAQQSFFCTEMTLSPLQLWRYTLFTLGMFFPEKNFSPDIENGIEYRYFSRYSVEIRKSSVVTDNTTRNTIVIIQLELQET